MTVLVKESATYADLEAAPPNMVAEIIFGALVTHPRPAIRHGIAASALSLELAGPFRERLPIGTEEGAFFQLHDGKWLLTNTFADSEDVSAPPFNEITFSLGLMWPLDPPSSDT